MSFFAFHFFWIPRYFEEEEKLTLSFSLSLSLSLSLKTKIPSCDLCVAADNAVFGQTGPKVGSFDAGYGCSALSRIVGQRKAREIWLLARLYDAKEAKEMGLVNVVVPLGEADAEAVSWARQINRNSPTALRLLKSALNAADDGAAGLQQLGGDATLLFYKSEEGSEGRRAFVERRRPDFERFGRLP